MEEFPCPLERTAASALLLLSSSTTTTSPSLSPKLDFEDEPNKDGGSNSNSDDSGKRMESVVLSDSKACSSSLSSDGSSEEIHARRLRIVAVVAWCNEMKLKVVRKSRSKNYRSCHHRKITSGNPAKMASGSVSANTQVSCLSSGSSARSRYPSGGVGIGMAGLSSGDVRGKQLGSVHMRRRGEAILRLLSGGCSTEVRIRRVLGDSPDTSKALRMLLKLEEVKRTGEGGRQDPYIYRIA
ncbi:hypothetical protein AAG906_036761 [Vitis piasezkii]